MGLLDTLKAAQTSPLIEKLKAFGTTATNNLNSLQTNIRDDVLNPAANVTKSVGSGLVQGINQQFGDIMGFGNYGTNKMPNTGQFAAKLGQGAVNTVKDLGTFAAQLPGGFAGDVIQGGATVFGKNIQPTGIFTPKIVTGGQEQKALKQLALQSGISENQANQFAALGSFGIDLLRAFTLKQGVEALGQTGVGISKATTPKIQPKPVLSEGQITPELINSFKNNAADQIEGGLTRDGFNTNTAKFYADKIRNADYSNATTISQIEETARKAVGGGIYGKGRPNEAVEMAIRNWAKSAEQIRYNAMEMAKNPNVTKVLVPEYSDIKIAPIGSVKELPTFGGFRNLSTTILEQLKGRDSVSKQFISDLTNQGSIKQAERDVIRNVLDSYLEGNIPVKEFATKVQAELLPLKATYSNNRYEQISLPQELRGNVANYKERIYQSPIKTSAGDTHFGGHFADMPGENQSPKGYFGHTRIEDMADAKTRRVIEVQSDLYQKGNLEREFGEGSGKFEDRFYEAFKKLQKEGKVKTEYLNLDSSERKIIADEANKVMKLNEDKLQQYNDPTAHFRMVREEVKQAAKDGKTKLQFPTGETAMKIEGLGENPRWVEMKNGVVKNEMPLNPGQLKVGMEISHSREFYDNGDWIITDVLGDGKFKAVPKSATRKIVKDDYGSVAEGFTKKLQNTNLRYKTSATEEFDISGKLDTSNPIYRFYEKDLGRYLKSKYNAVPVTDKQGVTWYQVDIKPQYKKLPVEAFGIAPILLYNPNKK